MRGLKLIVAVGTLALLPACNLLGMGSGATDPGSNGSVAAKAEDPPAEKGEERRREEEPARNESRSEATRPERASSDQDWILGRWGDEGCQTVLEIQRDGSYLINGNPGQWTLDGTTLTMSDGSDTQTFGVIRDGDVFSIEDGQGNVQQLGRC